jgi:Flp pilus assembly protein TadD
VDRLPDAEKVYRKALELSPQRIGGYMVLAIILADQGRDSDALAAASLEPADWARLTSLAYVHFRGDRKRESDIALRQLEARHGADAAYQIAAIHSQRGDLDAAFTWLDRSIAERDAGTAQVVVEPAFRPLHGDPRWAEVLKKVARG